MSAGLAASLVFFSSATEELGRGAVGFPRLGGGFLAGGFALSEVIIDLSKELVDGADETDDAAEDDDGLEGAEDDADDDEGVEATDEVASDAATDNAEETVEASSLETSSYSGILSLRLFCCCRLLERI